MSHGQKGNTTEPEQQQASQKLQPSHRSTANSPKLQQLHASKIPQSPRTANNNILSQIQKQIQEQSESIRLFSIKLDDIDKKLSSKIDEHVKQIDLQVKQIKSEILNVTERIHSIENNNTVLAKEQTIINTELQNMKHSVHDIITDVSMLKTSIPSNSTNTTKTDELASEMIILKKTLQNYENNTLASDAILYNIPVNEGENLTHVFRHLCITLNFKPPSLKNIFRTRTNNNNYSPAIIVKFNSPLDRTETLKSISQFRKANNRQLCLRDVGIQSDVLIYLRECLTKTNQKILHAALIMKKQKQISAVFTMRGRVFIKRDANDNDALVV